MVDLEADTVRDGPQRPKKPLLKGYRPQKSEEFTLDGTGNLVNGKATASLNGGVTDETFAGTYSVNPDCTRKLSIVISDLSGNKILSATLDLVFDSNFRHLRALFTSAVLPNNTPLATVITVDAKKLFSEN